MNSPLQETEEIITMTTFDTLLGSMVACATKEGICLLEFSDSDRPRNEIKVLTKRLQAKVTEGDSKYFEPLRKQLNEYFEGKRKGFDIPLVLLGTDFQKKVWGELLRIPYGTTRSYKQQAMAINNLGAIRAVGTANGDNKIAIIIPCHRVIGNNGKLTGYGGGLWRKKKLLEIENSQLGLKF